MNIIPELSLNKNPNKIKSGSIVCAKNIIIDDSASYITNEYGFKIDFQTEDENEKIVGCISCNNEIVIFTDNGSESFIYRKPDNESAYKINHKWKWSGGKLVGDYTYNYKNQLVIILGEYGVDDKKIPLKSWILTNSLEEEDNYIDYKICPDVPKYNTYYDIKYNQGNLLCGQYIYFIRFKIYEDTYTSWFQITDNINIVNLVEKEKPILNYSIGKKGSYSIRQATVQTNDVAVYPTILVNDVNHLSNKAIILNIQIDNSNYKEYQIGYIFKKESEVVGRILGTYNIDVTSINIIDNTYLYEEVIDEFYKSPIQFYNVKNVRVYNNRAYISNYEEEDNVNYNTINCEAGYILDDYKDIYDFTSSDDNENGDNPYDDGDSGTEEPVITEEGPNYNITLNINNLNGNKITYSNTINLKSVKTIKENDEIYIKDPINYVLNYIANTIQVVNSIELGFTRRYANEKYFINKNDIEYRFYHIIRIGSFYDSNYIEILNTYNNENLDFKIKCNPDNTLTFITENESIIITDTTTGFGLISVYSRSDQPEKLYYYNCRSSNSGYFVEGITENESIVNEEMSNASITLDNMYEVPKREIGGASTIMYLQNKSVNTNNYFNRTLLPYQVYNFYVHFIRKNGSTTNGFKINITNKISDYNEFTPIYNNEENIVGYFAKNNTNIDGKLIIPKFNVTVPDEFIGYFITYEQLENKIFTAWKLPKTNLYGGSSGSNIDDIESNARWNSSAYLYNLSNNICNTITKTYGNNPSVVFDTLKHVNKSTIEKHFKVLPNDFVYNIPYIFYNNTTNIYNKEYKTLYRLTQNIYKDFNENNYINCYHLPGFYSKEIIPYFTEEIIGSITSEKFISPIQGGSFGQEGGDKTKYPTFYIKCINEYNYSEFPYFALSIKVDYEEATVAFTDVNNTSNPNKGIFYNKTFMPIGVKDFMELKQCYYENPIISYTNYNKNNIDIFNKTIYRSDVYSDENLNNTFRKFDINNYKNIFENKGKITNIVPIGLVLLIHTEYSLFAFDRSPKLSLELKSKIPDTFDTNYQQVNTKSYGGLINKDQSIITTFGYIWYDFTNKHIFRYDDNKFSIISFAITNFLKYLDITDVRFAFDSIKNRLIISIKTNTYGIITLSYNFNTETFISLHDYYITNNYNTSNKSYIFNEDISNNKLYIYDKEEFDYKELNFLSDNLFDIYLNTNKPNKYIDIIINDDYEIIKSIESITYILNEITNDFDLITIKNTIEENLNKRFSGDLLLVYTDETNTGELNINTSKQINTLNEYKYPYWNKGKWNLNYFRNNVATNTNPTNSDKQSIIYGRYFVIRFIFNNDRRFKLENLDVKMNIY